jgi:apolipoprotein D and lipocalin family protein
VNNTCQANGQAVNILGTAAPANPTYGATGVFQVGFPGQPGPDCPGPNYIVQGTNWLQQSLMYDFWYESGG